MAVAMMAPPMSTACTATLNPALPISARYHEDGVAHRFIMLYQLPATVARHLRRRQSKRASAHRGNALQFHASAAYQLDTAKGRSGGLVAREERHVDLVHGRPFRDVREERGALHYPVHVEAVPAQRGP